MDVDLGLIEVCHGGKDTICGDDLCTKPIKAFDHIFLDTFRKRNLCSQCGTCLRYARKKAAERGEPVEKVMEY